MLGHPQSDTRVVAVVAGSTNGFVGTEWASSCLTNVVRKYCSHLVGALFLAVKIVWNQGRCLLAQMVTIASLLMSGHV